MKLNFFRDKSEDFLAYVTPLLVPANFSQNEFVYDIGDFIDSSKNFINI